MCRRMCFPNQIPVFIDHRKFIVHGYKGITMATRQTEDHMEGHLKLLSKELDVSLVSEYINWARAGIFLQDITVYQS